MVRKDEKTYFPLCVAHFCEGYENSSGRSKSYLQNSDVFEKANHSTIVTFVDDGLQIIINRNRNRFVTEASPYSKLIY